MHILYMSLRFLINAYIIYVIMPSPDEWGRFLALYPLAKDEISTHKVPLDRKGDDSEIALSLMVEPAYASSTALEISRAQG